MKKKQIKPETAKNPNKLDLLAEPGKSQEESFARYAINPAFNNMVTVKTFAKQTWDPDQLHLTELAAALDEQAKAAKAGDLSQGEGMLMVQAHTLDAIFNNLAQRAATAQVMPQLESYMRLALKAQSQCRATLESLANIKNPPIVYARQANVTTGPQQINNGTAAPTRARENEIEPTQLSGDTHELLPDTRTSGDASRVNPALETLGEIERAEIRRG
jgi:hypothetical protein